MNQHMPFIYLFFFYFVLFIYFFVIFRRLDFAQQSSQRKEEGHFPLHEIRNPS